MKKYHIITYGCQMNHSDSERIAAVLEKIGYKPASKINKANLIVVNMCSVRQSAVDRVFGASQKFIRLKTSNHKLKTVLTGCILKEDKKKFGDKFDLILDIKNLQNWPQILSKRQYNNRTIEHCNNYLQLPPKCQTDFSVLIPISNGCDNFCSYCVVPYVRGHLVCRPAEEILEEIKNLVKGELNPVRNMISNPIREEFSNGAGGAREIWLLGQNVNRYRSKSKIKSQKSKIINFAKLLRMVNDIPGDFWIRFTSPHPKDFSDELIEAMAKCKKVTPYLNLPLQSGNNKILKKMNRNYTTNDYKKLVKEIRKAIPEITLSTDVIVGFPGETKKQFENTAKLFRELKFDMAYISKYSPRPQTSAAKLKDNVPHQEKEKRWKILTNILKKTALKNNKKYIGGTMEVLVNNAKKREPERKNTQNIRAGSCSNLCKFMCSGKTKTYKTVKFESNKNLIGRIIRVKIIDALPWGLKGKIVKEKRAPL